MPDFGGYTIVRELHRTGLGCVHAAAKEGVDGGAEKDIVFAVKTCRPDGLVLGEEQIGRERSAFVVGAEYAKRIGDNPGCSQRWAKVYAIGRAGDGDSESGGGAFCVTDLATIGTTEKLVTGKVRLDGATLAWLVGEVVQALRDLEQHAKSGHGNLKLSNVLICGDPNQDLRAARVLLSDPSPGAAASAERTKLEDLRGIGAIIHALVMHSRFQGGWPVEQSLHWTMLGRDGTKWRELVNTLLDPNPRAERPTLEELAARLKPLAIQKRSRTPLFVGLAAALLIAGGATTALVLHYRQHEVITIVKWNEQPERYAQKWRDLCAAYRGWYSLFQDGLGKPPTMGLKERGYATRREAYAATDPQLKELLALPGVAEGFDPWSIAHVARDTELSPLANAPTDHARSDVGVEKTEEALASVDAIKKGLAEGWQAPQRLKDKAAAYKRLGWNRPAMMLENAAANVNPDKAPDPAVAVDSVLSLVPVVKKVDDSWEQIQRSEPAIAAMNDPVLAKFAGAASDMVAAGLTEGTAAKREDLLNLEKQAAAVADLASRLATFAEKEWPTIDTESFNASPKYAAMAGAAPSGVVYADWLGEVVKHHSLDPALDPRKAFNATELLAGLDKRATTLTGKPLKGTMEPAVGSRLAKVHDDVAAIAPDKLFWKRSNEQKVVSESARVKKELDELTVALDGMIERRRAEFAAAAGEVRLRLAARNEIVPESAAINNGWRSWRDAISSSFKDEDYEETAERAKKLEDALVQVGKSFPPALAKAGEGVPQTDWAAGLADASAGEREKRLGSLLSSLGTTPPDPSAEGFKNATAAAGKEFGDWTAKLTQMRTELGRAEEAMNSGQETTGPDSIESVVNKWSSDAVGQQREIAQSISGIKERVAATKALKAEKSAEVLVAKVMNPDAAKPEYTLAAWRRLGDADIGWPRTPEQFEQGKQMRAQLAGVIAKLPETRRAPLAKQVSADLASRWARYAASVRDPRVLEAAFASIKDYSVAEDALEPSIRYNLLLSRLRAEAKPDASDEHVVEVLGAFDRTVRGLGTEVAQAQNVAKLLAGAAPLIRGEEIVRPKVDPRTLGPGKMGGKWQGTLETTTADLTFTRGSTTLFFVRVALPGPDPDAAVYLCTRELSIGDATEIVDAASGWTQFKEGLPQLNVWITPRGWNLDPRGVLKLQSWMTVDANMTAQLPGYAPGILQQGQIAMVSAAAGGEPQRDHPLQEIPPYTLAYVARLAGCRFPTSGEWLAAHKKFDGDAIPPGANLRDATFERQKQHIKAARAGLARQDGFPWPDVGAFRPMGKKEIQPPTGEQATSRPENDGILWFAPTSVGGGDKVHHLVGNVAELVVEDGPVFERSAPTDVSDMLGKVTLGLIGGSALSAPELPIDKVLSMDAYDTEGYADVGCRLAFNAAGTAPPRESFATRLNKLLTDDAYLLAK